MTARPPTSIAGRRATALAAMVGALVIVQLIVLSVVMTATRDAELLVRAMESGQALYAAESGVNLAYREIALGIDEDGDGQVGGVSDDDDPATDPALDLATLVVTFDGQTLTALGSRGLARRTLQVEVGGNGGGNGNGGGSGNGGGNGNGNGN